MEDNCLESEILVSRILERERFEVRNLVLETKNGGEEFNEMKERLGIGGDFGG